MSRYTPQQFEEHYKRLPPLLRQALQSPDNAEKMIEMGRKHGLTIEEIGYTAEEIGFVIMGLTPARSFVSALKERLKKPEDEIKNLAADINHEMLHPLREELKKAHDFDLTTEAIQEGAPAAIPKKPLPEHNAPSASARKILESGSFFPPKTRTGVQTFAEKSDTEEPQIPHTGIRPIDLRKSMVMESEEKTPPPAAQAAPHAPPKTNTETPVPAPEFPLPKSAPLPQKPPPPPSPPIARPAPIASTQGPKPNLPHPPQKPLFPSPQKPAPPPYFAPISEKVPPLDLRKHEQPRKTEAPEQTQKEPTGTKGASNALQTPAQKPLAPSAPHASLQKPEPQNPRPPTNLPIPKNIAAKQEEAPRDHQKPTQAEPHREDTDPYREAIE